MKKLSQSILVLFLLVLCLGTSVFAENGGKGTTIDLTTIREQVLEGNRDYLKVKLEVELAKLQLINAQADNLQRASAVAVKQAESALRSAERNSEITAKNVQLDAETKYYNLLKANRGLLIAQDTVDQAEEQLRVIQAKYEEGLATTTDVARAEQAVLQGKIGLDNAIHNLKLAKVQLNQVLGWELDTDYVVADDSFTFVPFEIALGDAIQLAQEHSPQLKNLQEQLDIAKIDEKAADNDYTAPLITRMKKLQREQAEMSLQSAQEQVIIQTMDTWNTVQSLASNYQASLKAVEIAKENYRIIQLRLEDGLEIPANLLSAQLELEKANQQVLTGLFDYTVAKSNLLIQLGLE